MLELDEVPSHLIVLGSGYVGLEFAQAMRRFGSKVTVIGRSSQLLRQEDEDVGEALHRLFEDEGIDLILNARIKQISGTSGQFVKVLIEQNGTERTLAGSHLLVALGRIPNTKDIGLELAGVETTGAGYIKTNERVAGELLFRPRFLRIPRLATILRCAMWLCSAKNQKSVRN